MIEIDFDKAKNLKYEYYRYLKDYNARYNKVISLKKELKSYYKEFTLNKSNLDQFTTKINEEIIYHRHFLKKNEKKLIKLKKQIKEAEREFNDYVNSFYIDYENYYGQPYKSYKYKIPYDKLKNAMKYFYYTVKQIKKQ